MIIPEIDIKPEKELTGISASYAWSGPAVADVSSKLREVSFTKVMTTKEYT